MDITDNKVEFYKEIKEVEKRLNDNGKYNVVLNSFIISSSSNIVADKKDKHKWETKHVYFMDDADYINKIFENMK